MNFFPRIVRFFLKMPVLRKHYYGIYIKVIKPLGLFRNTSLLHTRKNGIKMQLDIGEWIQQQIYFFDAFDERGIRFLQQQLLPGDVFVDVGANIGGYALEAGRLVGEGGKVFAFEPVGNVFERLLYNVQLNGMKQVVPEKMALLDKSGGVEVHVASNENLGMSSIFHHDTESGTVEWVEAICFDNYADQIELESIKLIKIDVEGAELEALMGMEQSLNKFRPVLIVEISDEVLHSDPDRKQKTIEWLQSRGYVRKWLSLSGQLLDQPDKHSGNYFNFVFLPEKQL